MKLCPTCQQPYPDDVESCPKDGTRLTPGIRDERECPHCAEQILKTSSACKHCGRELEPVVKSETPVQKIPTPAREAASPPAAPAQCGRAAGAAKRQPAMNRTPWLRAKPEPPGRMGYVAFAGAVLTLAVAGVWFFSQLRPKKGEMRPGSPSAQSRQQIGSAPAKQAAASEKNQENGQPSEQLAEHLPPCPSGSDLNHFGGGDYDTYACKLPGKQDVGGVAMEMCVQWNGKWDAGVNVPCGSAVSVARFSKSLNCPESRWVYFGRTQTEPLGKLQCLPSDWVSASPDDRGNCPAGFFSGSTMPPPSDICVGPLDQAPSAMQRSILARRIRSTWKDVHVVVAGSTMSITHPGMNESGAQQIIGEIGSMAKSAGLRRINFVREGGMCQVEYYTLHCEYTGGCGEYLGQAGNGWVRIPEVRIEPCEPHTWVYDVP